MSTDGIDIHSITFQGTFDDENEKGTKIKRDVALSVWVCSRTTIEIARY